MNLGSKFIAGDQKPYQSCPVCIISFSILPMIAARNIVAYKGQSSPGSGAIDSALRLQNVASTGNRRNADLEHLFDGERTGRKSLVSSHWIAEPVEHLPETWSARLVMPAQPAPGECHHKYK